MRYLVFVVVFAVCAASARADGAFGQCWGTTENNIAFETCLADMKQKVDVEMAAAYAAALEGLGELDTVFGNDHATLALARAQKAFELYRDLDCDTHGLMAGPSTASRGFHLACWIDRSRERIAILAEWRPIPAAEALAGDWRVLKIGEESVLDTVEATLTLNAEGEVSGNGGCNRFFGSAEYGDETLKFGPLGATRMACGEAVDSQEHNLMVALERVRRWSFGLDGVLLLQEVDGSTLIRLGRAE